jgi:hypothetical protein
MRGDFLKEVQEILGHKTITITLRYAHLSQEHKKKAVNLLIGLTALLNSYDIGETKRPERQKGCPKPGFKNALRQRLFLNDFLGIFQMRPPFPESGRR